MSSLRAIAPVLAVAMLTLAGCAAPASDEPAAPTQATDAPASDTTGQDADAPGGRAPSPAPAEPPYTIEPLREGDFWTFYWEGTTRSSAEGSGTRTDASFGHFTLRLGAPESHEGRMGFPVAVEGDGDDGASKAPRVTHIAVEGVTWWASFGDAWRVVVDESGAPFEGGGLFAAYGLRGASAQPSSVNNRFIKAMTLELSTDDITERCSYDRDLGQTLCGDSGGGARKSDHFIPGVGPVAHSSTFRDDQGGAVPTSYTSTTNLGLVATSRHSTTGWAPTPPIAEALPPPPTIRYLPDVATTPGFFYVIGGRALGSGPAPGSVDAYDIDNRTWSVLPDPPLPMEKMVGAGHNGSLFVFGQIEDGRLAAFVWHPENASWAAHSATDAVGDWRHAHAFALGDLPVIRVITSDAKWKLFLPDHGWFEGDGGVEARRDSMALATSPEGHLYAAGGSFTYRTSSVFDTYASETYDDVGRWHADAEPAWQPSWGSLLDERAGAAAVVHDGKLFVMSGHAHGRSAAVVEAVDLVSSHSVSVGSLLVVPYGGAAQVVGDSIYLTGISDERSVLLRLDLAGLHARIA